MSPGKGIEFAFWGWREPEVSTWSRAEKKVERSGRRGGGAGVVVGLMPCSTTYRLSVKVE